MSFRLFLVVLALLYLASVLYVHWRGRERLSFKRQLVDHSGFFAPYNVLMQRVANRSHPENIADGDSDAMLRSYQQGRPWEHY